MQKPEEQMSVAEKMAYKRSMLRALLRGVLLKLIPSVEQLSEEFWNDVQRIENRNDH